MFLQDYHLACEIYTVKTLALSCVDHDPYVANLQWLTEKMNNVDYHFIAIITSLFDSLKQNAALNTPAICQKCYSIQHVATLLANFCVYINSTDEGRIVETF